MLLRLALQSCVVTLDAMSFSSTFLLMDRSVVTVWTVLLL